jgi:protein O-mannosyl-transferase
MKKKYTYLIVIFLIVASCAAFGRIAGNDFINFDDPKYITGNNHIKSGINSESIKWAFSSVELYYWQPLTWLSHMLDWRLFKEHAGGHHLMSLLLHIGSVLLLFFFLYRTTKNIWPSAFAAALFALHPLRVESVAWAAERKDVLSMFFGLASVYAYAFYAENPKFSRYFLCLILFALSLMSKPMLVTLPFVLLLLDYWPLGRCKKALIPVERPIETTERAKKEKPKKRKADSMKNNMISIPLTNYSQIIRTLLLEKVPFIFLTFISSLLTLWGQNKFGVVISMENINYPTRVANAIISYGSYLGKTFLPVDLAIHYPYAHSFPFWQFLVSCFILIGITIVVIYTIKKMPFLFVGWFWYLGTLIPVIGLVQVASQAMADRYTYLPSIGIFIMLSFGMTFLLPRQDILKKVLFLVAIVTLFVLTVLTWHQCGYWKNSTILWNHALQATKDNDMADGGLAIALLNEGKTEEAIRHFNEAIRINPMYQFYKKRGGAYAKLGQYQQAIEDYNAAILLKPDYAEAYNSRGFAYLNQGNKEMGCLDAQKACSMGVCKTLELAKGNGDCR